jgi:DNA-binding transcriptional LysR family regulator
MDVDTRLLRYFVAVAEEGSLTRAAERLFVSQPALTKQIKQLETQLGVQLFTRSRTGMALTEPGQTLVARVPALLTAGRAGESTCGRPRGRTRRQDSPTERSTPPSCGCQSPARTPCE